MNLPWVGWACPLDSPACFLCQSKSPFSWVKQSAVQAPKFEPLICLLSWAEVLVEHHKKDSLVSDRQVVQPWNVLFQYTNGNWHGLTVFVLISLTIHVSGASTGRCNRLALIKYLTLVINLPNFAFLLPSKVNSLNYGHILIFMEFHFTQTNRTVKKVLNK